MSDAPASAPRPARAGSVVLCGGRSSRMGRPKALLPFEGELLLQRVVRVCLAVTAEVVVVAAGGQTLPELPEGVRVARDEVEGRGPLQGIAAGLDALAGRVDAAYVSSTDVPFLAPAFLRRVLALMDRHDVVVPHVGGRHHPLAAAYRIGVRHEVRELLLSGRLRPLHLFERVDTLVAERELLLADPLLAAEDPDLASLQNVNTTEEYENALRAARARPAR